MDLPYTAKIITLSRVKLLLFRFLLGANRYVIAKRFFFHVVAVYRISPGPASAANVDVLALSAFAFIGFEIPQVLEYFRILPDLTEGRLLNIAG